MTAAMERPTARMELSLVLEDPGAAASYPQEAVRSPNLLICSLPSVEQDEVLLQQVIRRDVSKSSKLETVREEPAVNILPAQSGIDELAWLADATPIYGEHFHGLFRAAFGEILSAQASKSLMAQLK